MTRKERQLIAAVVLVSDWTRAAKEADAAADASTNGMSEVPALRARARTLRECSRALRARLYGDPPPRPQRKRKGKR